MAKKQTKKLTKKSKSNQINEVLDELNVSDQAKIGEILHLLEMRSLISLLKKTKVISKEGFQKAMDKETESFVKFVNKRGKEIDKLMKEQKKQATRTRQDYFG